MQANTKNRKAPKTMTLSQWSTLANGVFVVFGLITAGLGIVAWDLGRRDARAERAESLVQRERTAKAEKELLELKERAKPRQISTAQRAGLIGLLMGEPKGQIRIECMAADAEGISFAHQLAPVITAAGWPAPGTAQVVGIIASGVGVMVKDAKTAPKHAIRLQRALEQVGIGCWGQEDSTMQEGDVLLVVGTKPGTIADPR